MQALRAVAVKPGDEQWWACVIMRADMADHGGNHVYVHRLENSKEALCVIPRS